MFGQPTLGPATATPSTNRMNDFEVTMPPDDSVSALEFSPSTIPQTFLIADSWDSSVRCWEVEQTGKTVLKSMKTMSGPVLDVCWSDDGTKVYMASCDKQVKMWDLPYKTTMTSSRTQSKLLSPLPTQPFENLSSQSQLRKKN